MLSKAILNEYYRCLAMFNYDKAKQIIESCHSTVKSESRSTFLNLSDSLLLLITLERKYYALAFLGHRRKSIFTRKERPMEGYQDLFDRATVLACQHIDDEPGRDCLILVCSVRSRMTEMYLSISQLGRHNVKSIGEIVGLVRPLRECLTDILGKSDEVVVDLLMPLLIVIELEVDILLQLAEAQHLMSNLYFLVPINLLYSADQKYQRFKELTSPLTTSVGIFSRSTSFSLLNWLSRFYITSLTKYTLYFHSVLMRQKHILVPSSDCLFENVSLDLIHRISAFVRRTAASNLLLIFDAGKQNVPFLGHGYVFPFSRGEKVSGLQSFPVIFSWPLETECSKQMICNLVTLILNLIHTTDQMEMIEHVIEPNNSKTYFLSRVEDRMYLALVYDLRREKDKSITGFMDEIRDSLSGKVVIDELASFCC